MQTKYKCNTCVYPSIYTHAIYTCIHVYHASVPMGSTMARESVEVSEVTAAVDTVTLFREAVTMVSEMTNTRYLSLYLS